MWLNKLYFQISNSKEKQCLTVDTRDVNDLGPGKFRTSAENNCEQTCYFNRNNSDSRYKFYAAKRVSQEKLVFSISNQIFDQNFGYKNLEMNSQNLLFDGNANEKSEFINRENFRDGKRSRSETSTRDRSSNGSLQPESTSARVRGREESSQQLELREITTQISSEDLLEKNQDFYPSESSIAKRQKVRYLATRIKYSLTRVKPRNFLSNIGYTSISKCDFYNENFILDVYILLVKNLNPFSLQRKISDKFKHEMIYMLWREYIPVEFYRYICEEENFKYLNGRDVSQPGVLEIVARFIDQHKDNLRMLQKCLANYKDIFQYVYSHMFPEIYTMSEKRGIDMKSNFHILFKTYKDKQMLRHQQLAKQTINYETEHAETSEFEQKPILRFDEFNDEEELEMKQIRKEKNKKRKGKFYTEEEKAEKRAKKLEQDKIREKVMWDKLNELNSKFKQIKQESKEESKKMSATIL